MNTSDMQRSLCWLIAQISTQARAKVAHMAEKSYGLTYSQLHTLCLIDPDSPSAMNMLSCQMQCDASNITGIVDRLSAHGYIVRQDSPHDRRIKVIALTQKGATVRRHILRDMAELEPDAMRNLTPAECETLKKLLTKALAPAVKN